MLEDDTSTDFDDLDLGIDYDDPTLYSQLDSYAVLPTPAPPPLAKRPFVAPPRPAQAILRPAQPPAKKQRVEGPPRVERVAPKSGGAGRQSAGWVAREEEEMPEIRVEEGGYVRREGQGVTAIKRWGEGTGPPKVASPKGKERVREVLAGTSGLADDEKRELEALRAEKAALQESLQAAQRKVEVVETDVKNKAGEISVVRGRLTKAEKAYTFQIEETRILKLNLDAKLEAKDKEYRRELENLKVETAFRRQEIETSARRPTASQWSSSRARANSSAAGYGSMAPPPAPSMWAGSPSLGRAKGGRGASQRPAPAPSFAGFKNAFDSAPSQGRTVERELMPPPVVPRKGKGVEARTPEGKGKGKARMLVDGEEEEDEWGADEETRIEGEEEDREEEREERDWRGEILSALFSHTTFTPLDTTSSTAPMPPSQRSTFSLSRASPRLSHSHSLHSLPLVPTPLTTTTTEPIPTFHFLTNLRLPPTTSPSLAQEYEDTCRDLFSLIGKRQGDQDGYTLSSGIGEGLESLLRVLESASIVGPLVALFSLASSLILRFPAFGACFLDDRPNGASEWMGLLARVVRRFGRPVVVMRSAGEKKGKARERSRRVRGVVQRVREVEVKDDERVELEVGKRSALLLACVEVLEGLAWRMGERVEEEFDNFLAAPDTVATLLDPHQPTVLLTATTRFLSLLACRPTLFRSLIAVKFYDASDVRTTNVPIFDRIGTLLIRSGLKGSHQQMFALDTCLISLVTSLGTKHADAIALISSSPSLIPELLDKLFKDTRTLWEYDGQEVSDVTLALLSKVVARLAATVHLFYYLTCAPNSGLKIAEYFTQSTFLGLHDRFNVAFGTLSFASLPHWAEGTSDGTKLVSLGYLAQEIMEDVSPQEAEEIESCFASPLEEAMEEEDETMGAEEEMVLRQAEEAFSQNR